MKIPFPMFTIVLLFWGWQTNQWQAAAVMALLVEARYLTTWRWQAEDKDFYRLSDLATLLLVGLLLYPHITGSRQIPSVTYELQVLPYALLPILLGQLYSTRQTIPLAALFYTLRRSTIKKPDISVDYLFIGGCLTSASASPLPNPWYAPGVALLVLFFLWQHRPRRYPRFYWLLIVLASAGFAYMQQHGMVILQQQVGEKAVQWLHKWWGPPQDPFHRTTALGDVGPLKMSSSILFRVDQPHPWTMPLLLRESSYNTFLGKTWLGSHNQLQEIPLSTQVGWWPLHGDQPQGEAITVYRSFGKGSSMIATPQGTTLLAGLPAMAMEANAFGAIKIKDPPPFARFSVYYNSQQTHDRPPDEADLSIPVKEQAAIAQTAHQLGLTGLPPHTVIQRISDYFNQHFRYTVLLDGSASGESPISRFLLTGRAGHCEYFATSTVLLLRQAGIPTRYVFGYSVHEPEGKVRVVRQRHAHAWASAYVEGRWLDVDTTPPDWQESEAQAVSLWSQMGDLWSRAMFELNKWRNQEQNERPTWPWLLMLALLLAYLGWRLVRGKGVLDGSSKPKPGQEIPLLPFEQVEKTLIQQGWPPLAGESWRNWLHRVERLELLPLLELHYRQRFDPLGLPPAQQEKLAHQVTEWLKEQRQHDPH